MKSRIIRQCFPFWVSHPDLSDLKTSKYSRVLIEGSESGITIFTSVRYHQVSPKESIVCNFLAFHSRDQASLIYIEVQQFVGGSEALNIDG
jgi:hypothetical protein